MFKNGWEGMVDKTKSGRLSIPGMKTIVCGRLNSDRRLGVYQIAEIVIMPKLTVYHIYLEELKRL